jgi:glycosyltransferase involved in cell wall biosynthesis
MRLCVFPNDPIKAYFEKGEIKQRYYNPQNFFDEIHIISFTDNDVEEEKVRSIVGTGALKIHSVGKIKIKEREKHLNKLISLVNDIQPDVIRAYNPYLEGWFAAKCSEQLQIPFFVSLHTQYDQNRRLVMKTDLKKFFALKYTEKYIEPFVLKQADKITIVFKIIEPYVRKHSNKNPEILYNKINCKQFESAHPIESLKTPLIISVGNLIKEKNHECLIKAMKDVDAYCLIIGKGKEHESLMSLIKKEKLEEKVTIKSSVPHTEIQNYYKSAKIFALAYDPNLEGLPIPVMEAMATGLPIVIPNPIKEFSDGLDDIAVFADRTPESFAKNIKKLLDDANFYEQVSTRCKQKALDFDQDKIEKRERDLQRIS